MASHTSVKIVFLIMFDSDVSEEYAEEIIASVGGKVIGNIYVLDDAESVTACFNNGNGSWDSNNGANYTISAGTFLFCKISNKIVRKLDARKTFL